MSTNPNVVLLNDAWALLWNSTSPYYLPGLLAKGGTFGTTTIPPLTQLSLADMDDIPLKDDGKWGNVSISLTGIQLTGLTSITNRSFKPAPDASSVTAAVAFTALVFTGSFDAKGSGLVGCGMGIANGAASPPPPETLADEPSNMDLARQYRDELVRQSGPNGITLVSTYYDHNDTITNILNDPTQYFTQRWPTATPVPGKNTAHFMRQTSDGAKNRNDSDYVVGDDDYNTHAFFMSAALKANALALANGSTDPENPYYALATANDKFSAHAKRYATPSTFDQVMARVQDNTPLTPEQMAAVEEPAAARRGRELAERDYAEWLARGGSAAEIGTADVTTYEDQGNFTCTFAMPSLSFSGTVTAQPSVTLTALSADVPSVDIQLSGGSDPTFEGEVQSTIEDATWFQQTIGTQINAQLGSAATLAYLSNVINQALASAGSGGSSAGRKPTPSSGPATRRRPRRQT